MNNKAQLNWVRLPLTNLENCRELGGYETGNGSQTKWHTFLRSDNMANINAEEIEFLKDYGVKTVIDLRGDDETSIHRNPLSTEDFCDYHNIPLAVQPVSELNADVAETMGEFYVSVLEESKTIKEVFDVIANSEGGLIFHCMAGKDRTGIIAMLLLGLVGVSKKDIVSNYEVTYTNLESFQNIKGLPARIPESYLYSNRDYILKAYNHIMDNYQSIENYLLSKDIAQESIDKIKDKFTA
ncbi:tyrosine-protein phosphatase [Jeotgalicoccus huakuii]|nr:tyrosine-protein phosphatase [Jeotgalicoccus huakuii]